MWEIKNNREDYGYWKIENKKIRLIFWSIFILCIIYSFYPRSIEKMLPQIDQTAINKMQVRVLTNNGEENIIIKDNDSIQRILDEIKPYKGRIVLEKNQGYDTSGQTSFQLILMKKNSVSTINIIGKQYIKISNENKYKEFKLYGEGFNSEELLKILKEESNLKNSETNVFSPSDVETSGIKIDMTKEELVKKIGTPNKIEYKQEEAFGDDILNYYYEFGSIRLEPISAKKYSVSFIKILKPTIKGPRDIKVGDRIEEVLVKFPLDNKVIIGGNNIINKNAIKYVYGEAGKNNGYITYDEFGKVESITYSYGGGGFGTYTLFIEVENGKVKSINISVMNV